MKQKLLNQYRRTQNLTRTQNLMVCAWYLTCQILLLPYHTAKEHCKAFPGCFYTCIALNAVCRAALDILWFSLEALYMHTAHLEHTMHVWSSAVPYSSVICIICCNHRCLSFAHTTWTVRVLYWNLAWNDHCLFTETPICVPEIDLLTLNMLQHFFKKTLSRPKTYHSLSRIENGIYDCYSVSIANFKPFCEEPQYIAWLLAWINSSHKSHTHFKQQYHNDSNL